MSDCYIVVLHNCQNCMAATPIFVRIAPARVNKAAIFLALLLPNRVSWGKIKGGEL